RDARKKITQKAKMTVVHNGILIHKDAVLKGVTTGSADTMEGIPGPLLLQDHGNLVQFRNIWILPTFD
ncbi:MAG: family 16 glycoside hydrolase, partial [Planctomycetota bacterium]|nr:family 16 glycoside hydrolase [Planctomycetota bacterium]